MSRYDNNLIKIGYIKNYDPVKKYGFIQQYFVDDVFFHISNCIIKNIKIPPTPPQFPPTLYLP
jgi:hypothetical protein